MTTERHEFRAWTHVSIAILLLALLPATGEPAEGEALLAAAVEEAAGHPVETARDVFQRSGVRGGLVVHLGCGDGRLTAALRATESYLVQGLERDPARRVQARAHIRSAGLYGPVSVAAWDGVHLPYAENLVNLIVAEAPGDVAMDELMRVLAPRGVAMVKRDGAWTKTVKPWPDDIDEWTHYLHGPSNNAVADDEGVGPPQRLQWVCPPRWSRSHEHLASLSAAVSAGGRLFYILDEGPAASVAVPPRWTLVARDAFSGVRLWERPVEPWEWHLRAFRSGPTDLARRLVAVGNRVYVTLGYGQPVVALDAATGETVHEYDQTENTQEIIVSGGVLYLVAGEEPPEPAGKQAARAQWREHGLPIYRERRAPTGLMAVDAENGRTLWERPAGEVGYAMPTTLAVAEGRVFFQTPAHVICLDAGDGRETWRAERPVSRRRPAWTTPTLVVYDGVVLSADRKAPRPAAEEDAEHVEWNATYHHTVRSQVGELIALSAETGRRLWSAPCHEGYNAPVDILVAGGLVWTGNLVRARDPGIIEGRDPHTGKVRRTRPRDQKFYDPDMGHARCYRNKATERYLLTGRSGVEFVDLARGAAIAHHWVRGECQYGILPCNGLLYVPPHPCACFILAKLNSFHALAPGPVGLETTRQGENRLEKGPAYGAVELPPDLPGDWPTYRHDAARSGSTAAVVPFDLASAWQTRLPAPLTPPVAAGGHVYLASPEMHTLHALDARTGQPRWQFTAGGRIDSSPTVWNGLVLFGSVDGWVYCLRAEDGEVVWRHRAAPKERLIVADGQLESAWPVHSSVLVLPDSDSREAVVYAGAGRSGYLDGGIDLVRLDAATGRELSRTRLDSRDPNTGHQPHPLPQPTSGIRYEPRGSQTSRSAPISMPGALNDILSAHDGSVFMRHLRFTLDGEPQDDTVPHLHTAAGFLDDSWWHRNYWFVGSQMYSGYGGWPNMAHLAPSGRLLVVDGTNVYGFGRDRYARHGGSHPGLEGPAGAGYRLFLQDMSLDPRRDAEVDVFPWHRHIEPLVRAMVLAGDTLFVAGPRDPLAAEDPFAVWEGRAGGVLWAMCAQTGERLAAYALDAPPVFDGLIATPGRLLFSTTEGRVVCLAARDDSGTK